MTVERGARVKENRIMESMMSRRRFVLGVVAGAAASVAATGFAVAGRALWDKYEVIDERDTKIRRMIDPNYPKYSAEKLEDAKKHLSDFESRASIAKNSGGEQPSDPELSENMRIVREDSEYRMAKSNLEAESTPWLEADAKIIKRGVRAGSVGSVGLLATILGWLRSRRNTSAKKENPEIRLQ